MPYVHRWRLPPFSLFRGKCFSFATSVPIRGAPVLSLSSTGSCHSLSPFFFQFSFLSFFPSFASSRRDANASPFFYSFQFPGARDPLFFLFLLPSPPFFPLRPRRAGPIFSFPFFFFFFFSSKADEDFPFCAVLGFSPFPVLGSTPLPPLLFFPPQVSGSFFAVPFFPAGRARRSLAFPPPFLERSSFFFLF